MKAPLSALTIACVLTVSPALGQGVAHAPTPKEIASWMGGDHYPTAAFVAHAEGRTEFVLTVQADGRPSDCRITKSSGNVDLDNTTCKLFRKGRFNPAVDENGKKVVGKWPSAMRWVLPR